MIIIIGYACLSVGNRNIKFKTILKKNLSEENLGPVIDHNMNILKQLIEYNIDRNIKMFRITSDLVPFGDMAREFVNWEKIYHDEFLSLGKVIKENEMRVSFHPGQYTVLNSKDEKVVENAIKDLDYHTKVLDLMGLDKSHKIVLHVGGVYGDKIASRDRFIKNYHRLNENIKSRLVIENDHRSYNIDDLLYINKHINIPLVFDNLHNEILGSESSLGDIDIIRLFNSSWKEEDGRQKIHYSQQAKGKAIGSHSSRINLEEFLEFFNRIPFDLDIMLEVKDKDLSCIKCNNGLSNDIRRLEEDWARYKYNVLEHSNKLYNEIRTLLKDKNSNIGIEFYRLIDQALNEEITQGQALNGVDHVWGYFKDLASQSEKDRMAKYREGISTGKLSLRQVKNYLLKLSEKYNRVYLLDSYYFNF